VSTPSHDRQFFDTFLLVLGVLVAIAVVIYVLARVISARTQEAHLGEEPRVQQEVAARIAPVGRVAVAGADNSALEPATAAPAAAADAAAAQELSGEQVYNMACVACHGAGIAGAPKLGDAEGWAARIAQGADTLHQHAIQGFQGQAGYMPPKGGRVDLSDEAVMGAVDYMVQTAQ
jgi:cytochrome c5